MTRMAGWIEVPCYDFFLSTRSTIISLKLVADAACPGIIIRSLLSSTETREMLAMSTRTPPSGGEGGLEGGQGQGCVCVTCPPNLEERAQSVSLGWAGCPGRLAGKRLREDIAGWLLTGDCLYPPLSAQRQHPHTGTQHTQARSPRRCIQTRPGLDTHGHSETFASTHT